MKHYLSLLFIVPVLLLSESAAAAGRCAKATQTARVTINTTAAKVIFKTGHSRSDLARMQRAKGLHQGAGKAQVLGLTQTEFGYVINTSATFTPVSGGGYCAYPVSFDLSVGFSDFLVLIDRQYRRGSCEFAAIRDHELTHVTLYRSNLSRFLPLIRRQARIAAAAVKTIAVGDPDSGARALQDQMQRSINPLIARLNREADVANARIDTAKSYRNVHMLCDNW